MNKYWLIVKYSYSINCDIKCSANQTVILSILSSHNTTCLDKHLLQTSTAPNVRSSTLSTKDILMSEWKDLQSSEQIVESRDMATFYLSRDISSSAYDRFTVITRANASPSMVLNLFARNSLRSAPGERTIIIRCQDINSQYLHP